MLSFISIIGMDNFISVVTDGQLTSFKTNKSIQEDFKKFKKISKKQFVACTGNSGIAKTIFDRFNYLDDNFYDLKSNADTLRSDLLSLSINDAKLLGAIGGKNEKGELVVYTFSNIPDQEVVEYNPKGNEMSTVFLCNSLEIEVEKEFERLYRMKMPNSSLQKLVDTQYELNDIVADLDDTVNKVKFTLMIK